MKLNLRACMCIDILLESFRSSLLAFCATFIDELEEPSVSYHRDHVYEGHQRLDEHSLHNCATDVHVPLFGEIVVILINWDKIEWSVVKICT